MDKVAFQNHIEANLPERFKSMKVFRIPVSYNGRLYWASYKNGEWDFQQAGGGLTPVVSYTSIGDYEYESEEPTKSVDKKTVKTAEKKPVKEKPTKPAKEKPAKQVKEKPVKEKKVVQREPKEVTDAPIEYDGPMPSFVKNKPIKKLTGRFVFHIVILILSLGSSAFVSIPVIYNASQANKHINNPIEYWHYRSKSAYLHWLYVISLILVIVAFVVMLVMGVAFASLFAQILGGL
jgi:hypothetical protein